MSDYQTAARPYANAVFALAQENNALDEWDDALQNLAAVVADERVQAVLDDPDVSREQKAGFIIDVLAGKLGEKQQNLVRLMAENGRLKALPALASLYQARRAEAENKVEAEVISAFALDDEQTEALTRTLKNKLGSEITLSTRVDESLIGGVIIKAGDTIIDASMKSRLEQLALSLGR